MVKKYRKEIIQLGLLIIISLTFRLWGLSNFQYWSDDEQLQWFALRHILVDKHLSIVFPNEALGINLETWYIWSLVPWAWVVNLDPSKLLWFGNFWGLLSLIAIYFAGISLGGRRVGFLAGLIYAGSFMMSLFDRRLSHLSPDVLMVTLGIIALVNLVKGNYKYFYLITVPLIMSLNSDPSIGVVALSMVLTLLVFHPRMYLKQSLVILAVGAVFLSPLIIFNFKHNFQDIRNMTQTLSRIGNHSSGVALDSNLFVKQFNNLSKYFYLPPTKTADVYFCYCQDKLTSLSIGGFMVMVLLVVFGGLAYRQKQKVGGVLIIFICSYLIGIIFLQLISVGNSSFHYSIAASPIIILMVAIVVARRRYLAVGLSILFLIVNFWSLINSGFKYPLADKVRLVESSLPLIAGRDVSLYYSGDVLLAGGGWTSLFGYYGIFPQKGSLDRYWGHLYRSYHLYPRGFTSEEPSTVVLVSENDLYQNSRHKEQAINYNHAWMIILDNSQKWFYPEASLEKLYQPDYPL